MKLFNSDTATIVYSYVFVIGGIASAVWYAFRHGVHKVIEDHMGEIRQELSRLDRIEYALFNEGKTGLVNKVDLLIENQQGIKEDVLILKVQHEHKPKTRKPRTTP